MFISNVCEEMITSTSIGTLLSAVVFIGTSIVKLEIGDKTFLREHLKLQLGVAV